MKKKEAEKSLSWIFTPSASSLQTEIIRKRLHKDIPHHPVLMLNFCPELSTAPADLQKAAGEFIFLVDCSGSSTSIGRAKVCAAGPCSAVLWSSSSL